MVSVTLQLGGLFLFVAGTVALGLNVRRCTGPEAAERSSRVSHLLFWSGLVVPWVVGLFTPGPRHLDSLARLPSLSGYQPAVVGVGTLLVLVGMYFSLASNFGLVRWGSGTAAFRLTRAVVNQGVYQVVRNPMSLGYYLICLGVSLIAGSTYYVLLTAFGVIPAHVFNLKFFEETELQVRYGARYERYCREVPFLVPRLFN